MTTAHDILDAAAEHMRDRAMHYDKPEGERSMAATVAAFAAVTGIELSEEHGYLFAATGFSHGIDYKSRRATNFRNLSGYRFGRLTVVGAHEKEEKHKTYWLCVCDCGMYSRVLTSNLTTGKQVSCGCYRDESRNTRAFNSRKTKEEKRAKYLARKRRYDKSEKARMAKNRYFEKNKELCIQRAKEWSRKNPDVLRSAIRNRRAKLRNSGGRHNAKDIQLIGSEQSWKCAGCCVGIRDNYQADHVVPVSAGGSNDASNIQLLCPPCNRKKHVKPLMEFLKSIDKELFVERGQELICVELKRECPGDENPNWRDNLEPRP